MIIDEYKIKQYYKEYQEFVGIELPQRGFMKKIRKYIMIVICIIIFPITTFAHSGRTDANGGHHDYKNKSGLGSYHYHHGMGPHLHPGGVCPYGGGSSSTNSTTPSKPSPSISIVSAPSELNVGDNAGLEYSVDNATGSTSSVVSSDESVVIVNADKTLTAVGEGTATITISGSGVSEAFTVAVKSVPVDSITINTTSTDVQLEESIKLEAMVQPDNATDKTITWTSSDVDIIEIKEDGTITGKSVGTAVINCQSANGINAEISLNVFEVFPEEIKCGIDNIKLESGKSQELSITVLPENANNKHYTVEIKDNKIASLKNDSKVLALNDGDTEIVIVTDNGIIQTVPVTVYHVPVETISFNTSNIEYIFTSFANNIIDKDGDFSLKSTVSPNNATYKDIQWESSNPDIMTIVNDKMIIKSTGDVILKAKAHDNIEKSISFKVVDKNFIYTGIALGSICVIGAAGGTGFYISRRKHAM